MTNSIKIKTYNVGTNFGCEEEIVEADEDGYDHIIDGTESEGPSIADVATALSHIVEIHIDDSDGAHVTDYAPDSTDEEYGGNTEPGSAWDEECDRLLAEIREELPEGWQANWSDDDLHIERA